MKRWPFTVGWYIVGLKRKVKLCYVELFNKEGEVKMYKIFFSTNQQRSGVEILSYYKTRFQMEFNFRDGKHYTGLEHGQAKSFVYMIEPIN